MDDGDLDDDMQEAPLQLAIKTKYVLFMRSDHKFRFSRNQNVHNAGT